MNGPDASEGATTAGLAGRHDSGKRSTQVVEKGCLKLLRSRKRTWRVATLEI
jgi:hypothetical protein